MPQNELKQVIEYEELESQMISFDKFRLLYFELKHPENRKKMAELLEFSLKLDTTHVKEMVVTNKFFDYLQCLKSQLLQNDMTLSDFYDQIYHRLLIEDNLKLIHREMKESFDNQKISLSTHYLLRETLANFFKNQPEFKKYSEADEKQEIKVTNLDEKLLYIKTIQYFAKKSGVIDYLKKAMNEGFAEKSKEWKEYAEITEKLNEEKLSRQDFDAAERLKKDLEERLPQNHWRKIYLEYAKINHRDFKGFIQFINEHYNDLPTSTQKKLTEEILVNQFAQFDRDKMKIAISLEHTGSQAVLCEKNVYAYSEVKKEVFEFFKKNKKERLTSEEAFQYWTYIFPLIQYNKDAKNHYLLAFMQYIIQELYSSSASVSQGIGWLNHRMQSMLCEHSLRGEAEHYLIEIMISLLLDTVRQNKVLGTTQLLGLNMWEHKNSYPISLKLYDALEQSFKDQEYYSAKSIKYASNEAERDAIMEDLRNKEVQYIADIQKMIPSYFGYSDRDNQLVEKLLSRLAGVAYLKERIYSGEALSASHIRQNLKILFKDRVFATRQIRASHLSKVTDKLDIAEAKLRI